MDSRGQISFEYLITLTFAVLLVIAATVLAFNLTVQANVAKTQILEYRDSTIRSLLG